MKSGYSFLLILFLLQPSAHSQTGDSPTGDGHTVGIIQPTELWWFPDIAPRGYPRADVAEARIEKAEWKGLGVFKWEVFGSKGFNALGLVSDNGLAATVTKTDDPYVNIYTRGYSDGLEDVILRLTYTPPDASTPPITTEKKITVRTLYYRLWIAELYEPPLHDKPWHHYRAMAARDQFNAVIPINIEINEKFSNWERPYVGNNWYPPAEKGIATKEWLDHVSPGAWATIPSPVAMVDNGADTAVDSAIQTWRYGSLTPGGGAEYVNGSAIKWKRNQGYAEWRK